VTKRQQKQDHLANQNRSMFKQFLNKSYSLNLKFCSTKTESFKRFTFNSQNPDFYKISRPGVFYVDRTDYITHLETSGSILTFLRPKGFGKSTILHMLSYYYDVLEKDNFNEIFGHLKIGKNPTPERNSFLIFLISFDSLNFEDLDSFKQSLNKTINSSVNYFKQKYRNLLGDSIDEIDIDNRDAISSFRSLANFVKRSKFKRKVFFKF
jgi:hypothetical protein